MARVYNFSAGPSVLPEVVLKQAAEEMLDYNGAEMLKVFIFIFHGAFQPILRIKVQNNAALVEALLALKLGFNRKGEEFLIRFHLKKGSVIVSEMIIRPLPQISIRPRDNLNTAVGDGVRKRLSRPLKILYIQIH